MRNGILHQEGKPIFALGQSYYPSYHPQKVPVLEGEDRLGAMERDLRAMKDAGFHLVRMAALGTVTQTQDDVQVQFDLPDAFCGLCESMDLATMIRLQGYSMNLRDFPDATMLNQQGGDMPFHWSWFLRNSLNHPGIYEDNVRGTTASAAHFAVYPSVVSFQIYNEPAYPSDGFYDYHPYTLARYRDWLREQGQAPEYPPQTRPLPGEDPEPWVRWRLFSMERLSAFLCDMGHAAHEGYAAPENLTCHMSCPVTPGASVRGEDYFATAQDMDILGITAYLTHRGPAYHLAGLQLALAESAAATFGKHTWLIEYNARTNMPPQEWQRETYAAIGHGLKGILYYQWRADYPFADGPEPEGFGLLFNDGRKTPVFETAVAMNRMVGRLGQAIATMEKERCGLGILYSHHQNAYMDALDNRDIQDVTQCHERSILSLRRLYTQLSEKSLPVDFARACDLDTNPLHIRTLILCGQEGLSPDELDALDRFMASGGQVFRYEDDVFGFVPYVRDAQKAAHGVIYEQYDLQSLLDLLGIVPPARVSGAPCTDARLITGDSQAICCLIHYDPLERPLRDAVLHLSGHTYQKATAFALDLPEHGVPLDIHEGKILLPQLTYGALIHLEGESGK